MHKGWMGAGLLLAATSMAAAQAPYADTTIKQMQAAENAKTAAKIPASACTCGQHPVAKPQDRIMKPYAGEPADMSPYAKFAEPYDLNYVHPNIYAGAGRLIPDPKDVKEVRIGFFGPIEHNPEQPFGLHMLHGAQLAIEDANARGGYNGLPYRLMLHNDYDNWQAKTVYGDDRPTDPTIWGSASNEVVKMVYDDEDWAIFGSISSESTHIALRVALRAEVPIVNSASTDPTIPETYIPWYFTDLQDDRVQSQTLARRIFTELGLKRVALLRVNSRYGRFGVPKFRDAARRLGHPVVIEQKYLPGDKDFAHQLQVIRSSRADAIVIWADEEQTAGILKQMRAAGMKQPVFGSYRTLGANLLKMAGPAAEGFEAVFPYDANSTDAKWVDFSARYRARFHEEPEQFSALAYDAMDALVHSICKAGLNRARIHDALSEIESWDGVTGHQIYDVNQKNVAPMYLGTVHDGKIIYRVEKIDKPANDKARDAPTPEQKSEVKPYARVGEEGVDYSGPRPADVAVRRVVLFGEHANEVASSPAVQAVLAGQSWKLAAVGSNGRWKGATWSVWNASDELVKAMVDGEALAVIALDRDAAHLAEQLALKAFVPVIALSDDRSLTATNVPWIFRLPQQTSAAEALKVVMAAGHRSGANAEALRNVLASGDVVAGVRFAQTGEPE